MQNLRPNEFRNLLRFISQLGRETTERTNRDSVEIDDGEYIDRATISQIRPDGIVEIRETTFQRVLDCGHTGPASSIAVVCDLCQAKVCEFCASICRCNLQICRYCSKIYQDEEGSEKVLCNSCYTAEKRRKAALKAGKAIFGFFVKRED